MKCLNCEFENPIGTKFCGECGTKLEKVCPNCKSSNPYQFKFCGECGHDLLRPEDTSPIDYSKPKSYTPKHLADKILTTRSSIEGERKVVTVLFADVANYTSMAEKLDPEEIHEIMDKFFQILMGEIHRYEGTINQFTGDGIMALFGAPVAHEDHAKRACHSALSIQRVLGEYSEKIKKEYGFEFKLRIGLNSGPVIVGSIGDDLRMDYTAVGDTTNLASRMESRAKPGTILVTTHTHKQSRDFFCFDPLGKVPVKGKEEAVEAYVLLEATQVETRIEASIAKGLTKLVGREREIETLREAYDRVRSGFGQVVGIVGEAGVGKSRLLIELKNTLPIEEYTYLEGQCLHYGGSMTFLPMIDILKSYFDIKENDREYIIKKKIAEKIFQLDERLKNILPPFQQILSLKVEDRAYLHLEPGAKKLRTFEALRDLFIRESQNKLLILVIEDLHWIDSSSEEFLGYLIDWLAGASILLILLYRPEYTHNWGSKSYYIKIGVDQLSVKSSALLVKNILNVEVVVPKLGELIISRSGGNPLFVEELIYSLMENGSIQKRNHQLFLTKEASELVVPDTIQGIISARMDRVEEKLKQIMQVASVIGREFAYRILQTIMGIREDLKASLINLQGLEFIYEKQLFPELEYVFKHALTQEVAYNSLLQKKRKEIHEKIGFAIEKLYPDRLEEYYELLAYHYVRSDNMDKAVKYLDLANQRAAKFNAMENAKSYFDEAMKLLDRLPDTKLNQQRRIILLANQWLVFTLLFKLPDYYDILSRYEQMASDLGNQGLLGRFFVAKGVCEWWIGNFDQAIETLNKSAELCETAVDYEYAGLAYTTMQWAQLCQGNFEQSFNLKNEALRATEQQFNLRVYVWAFTAACWACTNLSHWEGAIENGTEALKMAEEFSDDSLISFSACAICQAYAFKGELDRAIEYGEIAVQKAPTPADKIWAEGFLAIVWCRTGKICQGIETLNKIVDNHRTGRFRFGEVGYANILGFGYFMAGEYKKATQILQDTLQLAEASGMKWFVGLGHLFMGQVALKTNPSQASYHFEQSKISFEAVASDHPWIKLLRGILFISKGKLGNGVKVLEDLSEAFLRDGSLLDLVTTEQILSNIYLQIVLGEGGKTFTFLSKNIAFLIKNIPRASEKAEEYLHRTIDTAEKIGAKTILGQAYMDMGLLYKAKGRTEQAKKYINNSIRIFEQCNTEDLLKQAKEAMES